MMSGPADASCRRALVLPSISCHQRRSLLQPFPSNTTRHPPPPPRPQVMSNHASKEQKAERVEARANDWMQKRRALIDQKNADPKPAPARRTSSPATAQRSVPSQPPPAVNYAAGAFNPIPRDDSPAVGARLGYRANPSASQSSPALRAAAAGGASKAKMRRASSGVRASRPASDSASAGGEFFGGHQGPLCGAASHVLSIAVAGGRVRGAARRPESTAFCGGVGAGVY